MQLGMIGLGRMGANLLRRLATDGHDGVANDVHADAVETMRNEGFVGADSLPELVGALAGPRVIWIMVPAAVVEHVLAELVPLLDPGDIVIDGGNSNYRDAIARAEALAAEGIEFVDIGTSGGVYGLERGFCLMVGGTEAAVTHLTPLLDSLAPGGTPPNAQPTSPTRSCPVRSDGCTVALPVPVTSSRWSTTASSTG